MIKEQLSIVKVCEIARVHQLKFEMEPNKIWIKL